MKVKRAFEKIDKILCAYLGLEHEETQPAFVKMVDNRLLVTNTSLCKRHTIKESWSTFSIFGMKQTSQQNRERLGLAAGKAIAKNLVISFEELSIKRN